MLHDGCEALVVDPGDAAPVLDALDALGVRLTCILVTHHHFDHVDGLSQLHDRLQGPVLAPGDEDIPGPYQAVQHGQQWVWNHLTVQVMAVPGHTRGHLAYWLPSVPMPSSQRPTQSGHASLLFCGDTLFSGGCGRLFEGTAVQMHESLNRLTALPSDTWVCCTHEYTLSNLRFAREVEPDNPLLISYQAECEKRRQAGQPTLPSTVALELQINPFVRCTQPEVVASALQHGASATDPLSVFTALRAWKNRYR